MSADHNLSVALLLAAAGIAVFPTDARKRPLIKNWDEASSSDLGQIRRWWRVRRGALAAIDLRKAGLVVIDADRHGGPDGVAAWHRLVREHDADISGQPVTQTPNNGLHVYFTQPSGEPLRCRPGRLPAGVECKGAGGSVTAPGNIKGDGTFYESDAGHPELVGAYAAGNIPPVPNWLTEIIQAPRAAREPAHRVDYSPATP